MNLKFILTLFAVLLASEAWAEDGAGAAGAQEKTVAEGAAPKEEGKAEAERAAGEGEKKAETAAETPESAKGEEAPAEGAAPKGEAKPEPEKAAGEGEGEKKGETAGAETEVKPTEPAKTEEAPAEEAATEEAAPKAEPKPAAEEAAGEGEGEKKAETAAETAEPAKTEEAPAEEAATDEAAPKEEAKPGAEGATGEGEAEKKPETAGAEAETKPAEPAKTDTAHGSEATPATASAIPAASPKKSFGKRSPIPFLQKVSPFKPREEKVDDAFQAELGVVEKEEKPSLSNRINKFLGLPERPKEDEATREGVPTRAVKDIFSGMSSFLNSLVASWPVAPGHREMQPYDLSAKKTIVDVQETEVTLFDPATLEKSGLKLAWKKTGFVESRCLDVQINKDLVLVETDRGEIIALNIETGAQAWLFEAEARVNSGPVVTDDGVFLVAGDVLYSVTKPELGVYDWRRPLPFVATTCPIPHGKHLVFGSTAGKICWFNRKWREIESTAYCRGNVLPEPLVNGEGLVFATTEGLLYRFSLDKRKLEWKFAQALRTVSSSPALDSRSERPCVLFGTHEQYLMAVDYGSGGVLRLGEFGIWEVLLSGPITQRPVVHGADLVLAIADGSGLHAINRETTKDVWFAQGINRIIAKGATQLYCTTNERELVSVDAKTGEIRWRHDISPFQFVPQPHGKLLIVLATNSGDVYALVPPVAETPQEDVEGLKPAAAKAEPAKPAAKAEEGKKPEEGEAEKAAEPAEGAGEKAGEGEKVEGGEGEEPAKPAEGEDEKPKKGKKGEEEEAPAEQL